MFPCSHPGWREAIAKNETKTSYLVLSGLDEICVVAKLPHSGVQEGIKILMMMARRLKHSLSNQAPRICQLREKQISMWKSPEVETKKEGCVQQ